VRIKRRRHFSSDEINASMRTLSDMQNDLKSLTASAEKLVESINSGVKAFKSNMALATD
jgi:t-SNARE complex subunit (syntaxin)